MRRAASMMTVHGAKGGTFFTRVRASLNKKIPAAERSHVLNSRRLRGGLPRIFTFRRAPVYYVALTPPRPANITRWRRKKKGPVPGDIWMNRASNSRHPAARAQKSGRTADSSTKRIRIHRILFCSILRLKVFSRIREMAETFQPLLSEPLRCIFRGEAPVSRSVPFLTLFFAGRPKPPDVWPRIHALFVA